jgi:hypothetical protein
MEREMERDGEDQSNTEQICAIVMVIKKSNLKQEKHDGYLIDDLISTSGLERSLGTVTTKLCVST